MNVVLLNALFLLLVIKTYEESSFKMSSTFTEYNIIFSIYKNKNVLERIISKTIYMKNNYFNFILFDNFTRLS